MSKKNKLNPREKELVLEAAAKMLVAELKEDGLNSNNLSEGLFSDAMDFLTGGTYSSTQTALEKGARGKWAISAAALIGKTKSDLPPALEKIKTKTEDGLKVTRAAVDAVTDEKTKKFMQDSIQKSADRIAAVQEKELARIAKAVVKRIDADEGENVIDDDTKKAYVGMIVQAAMLGALVSNLK